ncbi:MAG: hypothetical protein AABX89_07715 [Candidatus Thermoplasmatota archaeon]
MAEWADLAIGLTYKGTGPTALVAEIRLGMPTDCDLKVAGEFNATGTGVRFMTRYHGADGTAGATGNYHRQTEAIQAGPIDTRSNGVDKPGASQGSFGINSGGSLFVGIPNAQPVADIDWVPEGTVLVTSTCPGATGRWTVVGVDPIFFTPETPDGTLLVSVAPTLVGVVVAAERGFNHALNTPSAMLVANISGAAAGVLELTSPGGTESWNLATESGIWHEGQGGQQNVGLSQAGSGFLIGALFGVPG